MICEDKMKGERGDIFSGWANSVIILALAGELPGANATVAQHLIYKKIAIQMRKGVSENFSVIGNGT